MDTNILTAIITSVSTIIGAILGWGLGTINERMNNRVKLCFSLQSYDNGDLIEPEYRTKTSESGYAIRVYNVGKVPFLLEQISLRKGSGRTIIDCVVFDVRPLVPYGSMTYQLSQQEYNTLLYYCKESDISECEAIAFDVTKKKCKGKVDLFLPTLQLEFSKIPKHTSQKL